MKPFKQIELTKKVINELKYNHQFSKNKPKSAERINTLIDTVKMFDDMLLSKYKTDALDRLIYALIFEWLTMFEVVQGKPIPIRLMVNEIDLDLKYHSDYKKKQVMELLKSHTISNLIEKNELKDWDLKYPPYEILLDNLVKTLKRDLQWIKL